MKEKIQKLKSEKLIKKADVIIIAVAVFVVLALMIFSSQPTKNATYNIYVENELYKTGSMNKDAEIDIQTENGDITIVIENGKLHACHSTCPDGLCEKQGEISNSNSKIICLPLKVVAEIVGGENSQIDAVS